MQRFHVPLELGGNILIKNPDFLHQVNKVMRMKVGDQVTLFDGITKADYIYEISDISKREVFLTFVEQMLKCEKLGSLNLYQSLPNQLGKLEYIIQKGVEIGVSKFVFFRADRSQKLILSDNKKERLRKIMSEALEQCNGNILPELVFTENNLVASGGDAQRAEGVNILFYEKQEGVIDLRDAKIKEGNINVYVGPEGGWSEDELDTMKQEGFIKVSLGERILRTETAGIVGGFYLLQK